MFSKTARLRSERDIVMVRSKGSVRSNTWYRVQYLRKEEQKESRVAVVVSQRVSKSAVERNRLRRIARPIIAAWAKGLASALDVVVVLQPEVKTLSAEKQRAALKELLSKVE